jgi:3-deoxy-D-manno-octulosonic-acid transferase
MMHARYLCKQLRRRFPNVKLVVGLWDAQGDLNKARERIGCGATVVATLADAQEHIRLLIQQLSPPAEQLVRTEFDPVVIKRVHPSNYPSTVDVRSALQRVPRTSSVDSENLVSS